MSSQTQSSGKYDNAYGRFLIYKPGSDLSISRQKIGYRNVG